MKMKVHDVSECNYDIFPTISAGHGQLEYQDLVKRLVTDLLKGGAFLRNGTDEMVSR
jgi:hypothetical protein